MSGPIKSGFVHATRGGEASIQDAESRRGGVVGRKTGPGEPVEMGCGKLAFLIRVSDSFASGKDPAKQLERLRGIDETVKPASLFETSWMDDQKHQAPTVVDWPVGREAGFSQRLCSVE